MDGQQQMDPAKMQELQHFMQAQQQQVQVRALIGTIAQNCFKVCVDGKPGTRLSSSEQSCMSNCTMRFLDATKFVGAKATAELQPKNDNAYE